jgi:hypothetical protein
VLIVLSSDSDDIGPIFCLGGHTPEPPQQI